MTKGSRYLEVLFLLLGDIIILIFSLWLALFFRHLIIPSQELFSENIGPFSILILITVIVFFISGLYDKHTTFFKEKIPKILFKVQIINSLIAVGFFYFDTSIGVSPKAVLFLYLFFSFFLIYVWRLYGLYIFSIKTNEKAILIGEGVEYDEFIEEINSNSRRYGFIIERRFEMTNNPEDFKAIIDYLASDLSHFVILDMRNKNLDPILPEFYQYINKGISFVNFYEFYEQIFDRIPLSVLDHTWALRYASHNTQKIYDIPKRIIDIFLASILGIISLVFYPIVSVAIWLDDGGPVFIKQERIGKWNKVVNFYKFRSMKTSDSGRWQTELYESVTRVGKFLRKSRIDELPQLWAVILGDLSLVGPRPDIIDLGTDLVKKIPYYSIRTVIKPGLSGWAQIKQDIPPHSVDETKVRLSYDLYYIKHRSLILDLNIILKTIKTFLSRSGR